MARRFRKVGITTKGYWDRINSEGFGDQFPDSKFKIKKRSMFPELSQGDVWVEESLFEDFLKIKKEMTEVNGGRWIIW
ncbi:hypothetical protein OA93_04570 [Flavobacterium sp. KMS]|uniref:hypothetical protein n=1 Tax=Flavobacterium sp. KMS TaxID=1566023 RepID=UPI00057C9990|nr:hypothetical protein [Flavobacterium sp. KMS]KIA99445.1 hypothetical protein OA93_04570 [Flavobacterium sp. KMS]